MALLRRALVLLAAIALLIGATTFAAGRLGNVGPFAVGAPESWLYVAVSRGLSQEIEVIDTQSGERRILPLDGLARDIALSADRRTLYVALQGRDGRIALLDALRGGALRIIFAPVPIDSVAALPGGRIAAVAVGGRGSVVFVFDEGGVELGRVNLDGLLAGRPVHDRTGLFVPAVRVTPAGVRGDVVVVIEPDGLAVIEVRTVAEPGGNLAARPVIAIWPDGAMAAVSLGAWSVVTLPADASAPRSLPFDSTPMGPLRGMAGVISTPEGVLHVCVDATGGAQRYTVSPELELTPAPVLGWRCGRFHLAPDGTVYLVVASQPDVLVLHPRTGEILRTLPLTGNAGPSTN